jgi:DNA-binding response OmpR family regulator
MASWKVTAVKTGQDTNNTQARRVMIVDDDRNLSLLVATTLQIGGFEVVTAQDGETALDRIDREQIDAIVLDLRMPGMGGRNFYRELRSRGVDVPVLIASAYGARGAQHELGAEGAIEKPFDPERLLDAVQRLLK